MEAITPEVIELYKEDEKSNEKRASLQSRQIDETIALDRRNNNELSREEALIEEFYGPSRKALNSQIQDINQKLEQTGFRGLLYRSLKGRDAQNKLENVHKSLDNLEMRSGEMGQKLNNNVFTSKENLSLTHEIQKENLEMEIHSPSVKPRTQDLSSATIIVDNGLSPDTGMSKGRSR